MQVETTIKPIGASYIHEFVEFLFQLRGRKIFQICFEVVSTFVTYIWSD
jgi:hypothetical protein